MINNIEDVEVGHWITYRVKTESGEIVRRFYEVAKILISGKETKFQCIRYPNGDISKIKVIVTKLFENPDKDAVYETLEELKNTYPEDFI